MTFGGGATYSYSSENLLTGSSGGASLPKKPPCFTLKQYRENHDQWVAREVQRLRSLGYEVATEVTLDVWAPGYPTSVRARADIIARVPGTGIYIIDEIKTADAQLGKNQRIVFGAEMALVAGLNGVSIGLNPGDPMPINSFFTQRCPGPQK